MQNNKTTNTYQDCWLRQVPVLIAGGGPVGMTMAALLASYGVASLVIELDAGYCAGSRAIWMSCRSQEILGWAGAAQPLVDKGLSWVGGRSYFRDRELLHFEMSASRPSVLRPWSISSSFMRKSLRTRRR